MKQQPTFVAYQDFLRRLWAKGFIAGMWTGGMLTLIITAIVFKLNGWW